MALSILPTADSPASPGRFLRSLVATALMIGSVFGSAGYLLWRRSPRYDGQAVTTTETVLLLVLASIGAIFVAAMVARHRPLRRLRFVPLSLQRAVRRIVELSLFGPGSLARWTVANPAIDLVRLEVPRPLGPEIVEPDPAEPDPAEGPTTRPFTPPEPGSEVGYEGPAVEYRAERGDTWWLLAERSLGEGKRWRAVVGLNLEREVAPGVVVHAGSVVRTGWSLLLPTPEIEREGNG